MWRACQQRTSDQVLQGECFGVLHGSACSDFTDYCFDSTSRFKNASGKHLPASKDYSLDLRVTTLHGPTAFAFA